MGRPLGAGPRDSNPVIGSVSQCLVEAVSLLSPCPVIAPDQQTIRAHAQRQVVQRGDDGADVAAQKSNWRDLMRRIDVSGWLNQRKYRGLRGESPSQQRALPFTAREFVHSLTLPRGALYRREYGFDRGVSLEHGSAEQSDRRRNSAEFGSHCANRSRIVLRTINRAARNKRICSRRCNFGDVVDLHAAVDFKHYFAT